MFQKASQWLRNSQHPSCSKLNSHVRHNSQISIQTRNDQILQPMTNQPDQLKKTPILYKRPITPMRSRNRSRALSTQQKTPVKSISRECLQKTDLSMYHCRDEKQFDIYRMARRVSRNNSRLISRATPQPQSDYLSKMMSSRKPSATQSALRSINQTCIDQHLFIPAGLSGTQNIKMTKCLDHRDLQSELKFYYDFIKNDY